MNGHGGGSGGACLRLEEWGYGLMRAIICGAVVCTCAFVISDVCTQTHSQSAALYVFASASANWTTHLTYFHFSACHHRWRKRCLWCPFGQFNGCGARTVSLSVCVVTSTLERYLSCPSVLPYACVCISLCCLSVCQCGSRCLPLSLRGASRVTV
jgi:hypothetical protein